MIKKNRDRKKARNLKYVIIISYTLPSRFNAKQEDLKIYIIFLLPYDTLNVYN